MGERTLAMSRDYATDQPVRKPRQSGHNITGYFASYKNTAYHHFKHWVSVSFESTIEEDYFLFLEFDPMVIRYVSQPFTTQSRVFDGTLDSYTPDVLVYSRSRNWIAECKPEKRCQDENVKRQIALGRSWAAENEHEFYLILDTYLRKGHKLRNIGEIYKYAHLTISYDVIKQCAEFFRNGITCLTIQDLAFQLAGSSSFEYRPSIYSLIFHHILSVDIEKPLCNDTLVWLTARSKENEDE